MYHDLTKGSISRSLLLFALPMIAGNMLQQLYNIADTLIVGRVLGRNALAAVGSAYALMTFLTSIFLGLSMGAGALFSIYKGKGEKEALKASVYHGFVLIMSVTVILNIAVYLFLDPILHFLKVPAEVWDGMREYLLIIFAGILATSLYNFFACLLRALGNSAVPLWFLAVSALVNVGLALLFAAVWRWGIRGAAFATILAQFLSGIGITCYVFFQTQRALAGSAVQGLVNSFGAVVMAAFAAAVKIDTFAYLPVQDFGNAYATFVAQNYGAGDEKRVRKGTKEAFLISILFSLLLSAVICIFAEPLMKIFVSAREAEVIACGVGYLRIEGAFYCGIGCLFLLYGYYRGVKRPEMSVVLTVISLGMRVLLAYLLSTRIGEVGIWAAILIGWGLADLTGLFCMRYGKKAENT